MLALRARYHLYRQEWADAITYSSFLINDANYPLIAPYNSWWTNNITGSQESILETAYRANQQNTHRNAWQPSADSKGGIRSWFPDADFVTAVNDPALAGNRSTLVAKASNGQWYGDLYYRKSSTDPSYILRIAEQYLIRAEAYAQLEDISSAQADLNAVRTRAGLPNTTAATKDDLLLAIENERRFEFAIEPHRWFDLVRTNRADEVLGLTDVNKWVLPIPVSQILVDKALSQNPGY